VVLAGALVDGRERGGVGGGAALGRDREVRVGGDVVIAARGALGGEHAQGGVAAGAGPVGGGGGAHRGARARGLASRS